MEEIIKRAIEGGWLCGWLEKDFDRDFAIRTFDYKSETDWSLDPLFWQALAKACKWVPGNFKYAECEYDSSIKCQTLSGHDVGLIMSGQMKFCTKHGEIWLIKEKEYENIEWISHATHFHEINLTESWSSAVDYLRSVCGIEK